MILVLRGVVRQGSGLFIGSEYPVDFESGIETRRPRLSRRFDGRLVVWILPEDFMGAEMP
jgi:hypothetical protein